MAHKKAAGSTSLGRESESKRLGVKITDGEWAKAGSIIIRQRGTKYHPGLNVGIGKDDTLFALKGGFVKFTTRKLKKFNNSLKSTKIVNVILLTEEKRQELNKIAKEKAARNIIKKTAKDNTKNAVKAKTKKMAKASAKKFTAKKK